MGKPAQHRVPWHALAAALAAPVVGLEDPAPEHSVIVTDLLPSHGQAETIQQAEGVEVRAAERSVRHVEVFPVDGVRTPIIGRPRPLPRDRRAPRYTLNCKEPDRLADGRVP